MFQPSNSNQYSGDNFIRNFPVPANINMGYYANWALNRLPMNPMMPLMHPFPAMLRGKYIINVIEYRVSIICACAINCNVNRAALFYVFNCPTVIGLNGYVIDAEFFMRFKYFLCSSVTLIYGVNNSDFKQVDSREFLSLIEENKDQTMANA